MSNYRGWHPGGELEARVWPKARVFKGAGESWSGKPGGDKRTTFFNILSIMFKLLVNMIPDSIIICFCLFGAKCGVVLWFTVWVMCGWFVCELLWILKRFAGLWLTCRFLCWSMLVHLLFNFLHVRVIVCMSTHFGACLCMPG